MTTVYFVRHAQPNFANHDDASRELSPKGMEDRLLVTAFLEGIPIDAVFSSPYKRAVDTVADLAEKRHCDLRLVPDFRERKVDSEWIDDFDSFCKRQWEDFDYRLSDGESLSQVQVRNLSALEAILREYHDQTVVIGSHGTALSTIIHHYDPSFGFEAFQSIKNVMPWIVRLQFEGTTFQGMENYDVFSR